MTNLMLAVPHCPLLPADPLTKNKIIAQINCTFIPPEFHQMTILLSKLHGTHWLKSIIQISAAGNMFGRKMNLVQFDKRYG